MSILHLFNVNETYQKYKAQMKHSKSEIPQKTSICNKASYKEAVPLEMQEIILHCNLHFLKPLIIYNVYCIPKLLNSKEISISGQFLDVK